METIGATSGGFGGWAPRILGEESQVTPHSEKEVIRFTSVRLTLAASTVTMRDRARSCPCETGRHTTD